MSTDRYRLSMTNALPLSRPHLTGNEQKYILESLSSGKLSGDGPFTKRVSALLHEITGRDVLLTTSCTSALELAAVLLFPNDSGASTKPEAIIPSFTFVSTVNAFLMHGYKPVFCDVRADTGNVDAETIAPHITPNTRVIVPVHYAGIPCDMQPILALARKHGVAVVEDAAQAVTSTIDGKPAGTMGDLGAYSFHDTKNFVSGEGGALVINRHDLHQRAEILREKGTNRSQFLQGHVDKYTWVDKGGSFLPADTLAAMLLAQLEGRAHIGARRATLYAKYIERLAPLARDGLLRLPVIPSNVQANHHLFFIVLPSLEKRTALMKHLNTQGIGAAFHYPALHTTPMGKTLHNPDVDLPVSVELGEGLLRLPLFVDMADSDVDRVVDTIAAFLA
jgi:dTDP-4-amino-4,6-dideoxygalactose transaminase